MILGWSKNKKEWDFDKAGAVLHKNLHGIENIAVCWEDKLSLGKCWGQKPGSKVTVCKGSVKKGEAQTQGKFCLE